MHKPGQTRISQTKFNDRELYKFASPRQNSSQKWCRNWPTEFIWLSISRGERRLSAYTNVPHRKGNSMGGPPLLTSRFEVDWVQVIHWISYLTVTHNWELQWDRTTLRIRSSSGKPHGQEKPREDNSLWEDIEGETVLIVFSPEAVGGATLHR